MKKIKLYAVILITMFIVGIASNVNAESAIFTATADTQTIEEEKEVVITLSISDIDVNENGIYTFGGKLVYDKNIFEEIRENDFEGKNNWSIAYNNEQTEKEGTFVATRMTGLKTDQVIGTLKLKTKTNIKSTKTEIKFIEVSTVGADTIQIDDQVITLNVIGTKKDDDNNPTNSTTDDNTVDDNNGNTDDNNNGNNGNTGNNNNNNNGDNNEDSNGNGNNNSGNGGTNNGSGNSGNTGNGSNGNGQTTITLKNTINNQSNKDATTSGNNIPKTGVESMPLVLISVAVIAIMVVTYVKYKRNQDIK